MVVLHAATDALGRRYEASPVQDYPLVPDVVASIPIRCIILPIVKASCSRGTQSMCSYLMDQISSLRSHLLVRSSARLTAVTGSINSRKSPRPREAAGGYIDRDDAILASPTLKILRSPKNASICDSDSIFSRLANVICLAFDVLSRALRER